MEPGSLVMYYDDGWRYGYLVSFEKRGIVKVRPIAAFKQGTPRCVSVRVEDVKESEVKGDR